MFQNCKLAISFVCIVLLVSCTSLPIEKHQSTGQNARIQTLILHFTAINYARSMRALKDSGGVSSHYLIPESGDETYPHQELKILQLVDEDKRAWHAGHSYWDGRDNLNDTSIGIELVNVPKCAHKPTVNTSTKGEYGPHRMCQFPDFDPTQIKLVTQLAQEILARHPDIDPTRVIGHSDISPSRKNDPGPRFPWQELYKNGVGAWYDEPTVAMYWDMFGSVMPSVYLVQDAFARYGYKINKTGILDTQTQDVIYAFQAHFMPWSVTGELDAKTAATLFSLLEKYKESLLASVLRRYYEEVEYTLLISEPSSLLSINALSRSFYGVTGQGSVRLASSMFTDIKALSLKVNGQSLPNVELGRGEQRTVDISDYVVTGPNVLSLKSESNLAQLFVSIEGPQLTKKLSKKSRLLARRLSTQLAKLPTKFRYALVQHNQVVLDKTFGAESFDSDIPTLSSYLLTKLAILKLTGVGGINLDRAVSFYLPEFTGQGHGNRKVRHFLTHTSGYPSEFTYLAGLIRSGQINVVDDAEDAGVEKVAPTQKHDIFSDWQSSISEIPYYFGFDQNAQFSLFNEIVLQQIIETVSGKSYLRYINEDILEPLGIKTDQATQTSQTAVNIAVPFIDLLTVAQIFKNEGQYGEHSFFNHNPSIRKLLNRPVWLNSATKGKSNKLVDLQQCHPYLRAGSHIAVTKDAVLLQDRSFDFSMMIAVNEPSIDSGLSDNACGLSIAQEQIITTVMEVVYQAAEID